MTSRLATVLLVDDDPVVLDLLQTCLDQEPARFLLARSGAEALRLCESIRPDLILLDIGLPDVSGFHVLTELKRNQATEPIPVLALTAHNEPSEIVKGLRLGAVDYVTKPFSVEELKVRVQAVLRSKWLVDELKRAQAAAEEAARVKSSFLAGMSHEMHTPLHGIIAMADLLMSSGLTADQSGIAHTIRVSGERLLAVIQSALDLLKLEAGNLQVERLPFRVEPALRETAALWEEVAAERQVQLETTVAPAVPARVLGDQTRLRLMLSQMLGSALRVASQARVVLRTEAGRQVVERPVKTGGVEQIQETEFAVAISGPAAATEDWLRLLGGAGPANAAASGSTVELGQAFREKLVEFLEGQTWVRREDDTTVAFGFTLPLVVDGAPAAADSASAAPASVGGFLQVDRMLAARLPARILLVDDDAINRKIGARIFAKMGYQITLSSNAREAIEALKQAPYDIVFTDIQMPGLSGLEAARLYREADRAARPARPAPLLIVAMTANALGGDRENYLAAGLDDYVAKPVRPVTLQEIIERWSRHSAVTPAAQAPADATEGVSATNEALEVVDVERLRDFAGGDPRLLRETADLFVVDASRRFDQLRAAVEAGDAETTRKLAHSLVGSSATIGAPALVPPLQAMEQAGRAGELDEARRLLPLAEREFARARDFLARLVAGGDCPAAPAG